MAAGDNDFQSLPTPTTLSAMDAAFNANAPHSPEFTGANISLYVGDTTPNNVLWEGSSNPVSDPGGYTDSTGTNFTLPFQTDGTSPGDWTGEMSINGVKEANLAYIDVI